MALRPCTRFALRHHALVLARIRLTRTAAERGPVLSGACGQGAMAEINSLRLLERTNAHTPPRRVSARGRGVWTLAGASVECNYVASATAHPAAMNRPPALVEQQPR